MGLTARCVVPMRFRDRTIGEVNLFCRGGGLSETQLGDARLLASLATVALLTHRAVDRREAVVQRLQSVLNDRITIEQAKGVVAERESLTPSVALQRLRDEGYIKSEVALVDRQKFGSSLYIFATLKIGTLTDAQRETFGAHAARAAG